MFCPYCGFDKDEITDEHVIPRALGGNLQPTNPFLLRVCGGCNNACGRWVDGPFVRSWFVQMARAQAGSVYLEAGVDAVVPLVFIGESKEWPQKDPVCDFWLGPAGDHIYHFHRPYPGERHIVGKPPAARAEEVDPGSVYVNLIESNPVWHPIIKRSIEACFRNAQIHYMNVAAPGGEPPWPPIPPERRVYADWVKGLPQGEMRQAEMVVNVRFGDRFLAKVALGLGCTVLDPSFGKSIDAARLRALVWTREFAKAPVPGQLPPSLFLNGQRTECQNALLGWNACHVLFLQPLAGRLMLKATFYGRLSAEIMLTETASHFAGRVDSNGTVWVISPGLRGFVGPIPFDVFFDQKDVPALFTGALRDFHDRLTTAPRLPPIRLPGM